MMKTTIHLLAIAAICLASGWGAPVGDAAAPNVIVIMVDDLGYHDLSCYGHAEIKTPVIDQLAADGVKLTSFYAGATVCTPSRMALLTGAYPARVGWTKGVVGHLMENRTGLAPEALTMAEVFKGAGYDTGMIGKWHLGSQDCFLPRRQGFDESYFLKASNNQTDELWRDGQLVEKPFDNRLLTEQFTREAIRFIGAHRERPFFLYLPYSAPHFPVQAHPGWKGKSAYGVYGDVVEELDARIGEILQSLQAQQLAEKTIVVFLSDNGPEPGTKASRAEPLRGKKWSSLEGGTRVPCIVRWPGVLPAGRQSDALIAAIDLLPTLCHACAIDLPAVSKAAPVIDGINVWGTLMGEAGAPNGRSELLYWHGADGFEAIRVGDWKLFPQRKAAQLKGGDGEGPALFNLADDIGETVDLSAKFPGRVKEMQALAERRLAEIAEHRMALGRAE